MTVPTSRSVDLPGFQALYELGFSDVISTFVQSLGGTGGAGYALREDGTVWKWENRQVLVGNAYEPVRYVTEQIFPLQRVTRLAGEGGNSGSPRFALQGDGTVWRWGEEANHEADVSNVDTPSQVSELANVRSLVATIDGATRFATTWDGDVWSWGSNYFGHLGDGTTTSRRAPDRLSGVRDVSTLIVTPSGRCLALQSTGEVWTWGNTYDGARFDDRMSPTRLLGLPPIESLFEDSATATDGSFWMWDDQLRPSLIPGLSGVISTVRVAAPAQPPTHHVLLGDGTVWGWGSNENGQIGDGSTASRAEPVRLHRLSNVRRLVGRGSTRFALTHSGDIYGWGGVGYSDSLSATPNLRQLPAAIEARAFEKWASIRPTPVGNPTSSEAVLFDHGSGRTFLMHWAAQGDMEQIETLIEQGADVNAVDDDGDPALYYALSNNHPDIVKLLLSHGADPNSHGASGNLLLIAADRGWSQLVSELITHGADVDRPGPGGITAAMLAAGSGNVDILDRLCLAGADVDRSDDDGDSVLFYAASRGRVEAVRLLLERGANASPRPGSSGQTPLSMATILSSAASPLPPGTQRSDLVAIARLLTPRWKSPSSPQQSLPSPFEDRPTAKPVVLPTPELVSRAQYHAQLPRSGLLMRGVHVDGLGIEFVAPEDYELVSAQSRHVLLGLFNDVSYDEASVEAITLSSKSRGRPVQLQISWVKNYAAEALYDLAGHNALQDPSVDCFHFEERAPAPNSLPWLASSDSRWTTAFLQSGLRPPFPQRVLAYQGATSGWPGALATLNRESRNGDVYSYFIHFDFEALASDDWELLQATWKWKPLPS